VEEEFKGAWKKEKDVGSKSVSRGSCQEKPWSMGPLLIWMGKKSAEGRMEGEKGNERKEKRGLGNPI